MGANPLHSFEPGAARESRTFSRVLSGAGLRLARRAALLMLVAVTAAADEVRAQTFVCPPCAPHDTLRFEADGTCPVCGMELMEKPDSTRVDDPHLHPGSGNFLVSGGGGHEGDLITVFYHRPRSFTADSPVLLVVPGAGRDADEYRDAWIEASEEHGVLVLSPMYREDGYGFGDYHMAGLFADHNVYEAASEVEGTSEAVLDEGAFIYRVNERPEAWIFDDFDRIFEMVAAAVGSTRAGYDAFGHSAGGQILHRLALLARGTKAGRIVAGNSGFYTLPDLDTDLPFGLADAPVTEDDLADAFRRRLTVLLGEEDSGPRAGGTLLRSPTVDRQGAHRLARGRHFYAVGREKARELGVPFHWRLETVPGVGHDHVGMSRAAAKLLYGEVPDGRDARRFEADPAYRVEAAYEPLPEPRVLRVAASAGGEATVRKVGHARVQLPGGAGRLAVFRAGEGEDGPLWIPFRDATNGEETYRAGRYVGAEMLDSGTLRVDFNHAHNPACAYDPGYACPLPPPGNRLDFPVPAGEKTPGAGSE